ncbi:WD40-repeat-containing domain protein [Dendryphion nanum]|uniref:WD40-repeat-containing domain protein n=1 Tax=Dendryphion nanum TaxID=256645 RepID=A0A9P9D4B3_9PLEO|nr:WD40-repeat-containing domain protein [Dendryphion nanum]
MSSSTDPGHFFQTDSALEASARKSAKSKNTKGNPIKLSSKILAAAADPRNEELIYVAEAAGNVKRIKLETKDIAATFSGPLAPLTSLAVSSISNTVFAGCWDKTIWSWSTNTRQVLRQYKGHTDFVKAVLSVSIGGKELLISGSADASIIVWNVATGEKLQTLKGHTRGVLALAIDPAEEASSSETVTVFSAGSDREIRRWSIGLTSGFEIQATDDCPTPILAHQTSVDSIRFDADGDLWTASADKTAKCLSRSRKWEADTALEHPDFVRDIAVDDQGGWVATACRDEEVRVWEKGNGKLHHVYTGHYEEVTALVLLSGQRLVSVSIDGTVRQWSLRAQDLSKAIKEAEDEQLGVEKDKEVPKASLMTVEEERELAELLGEDD